MPVRRFRSHEEARRALWMDPGDPGLPGRIRRLWERSRKLAPLGIPRGLRKFRSIEEANAEREAWVRRRVRRIRERHRSGPAGSGSQGSSGSSVTG
jgi:hypothetical protein